MSSVERAEPRTPLDKLRSRFLLTQGGSIIASAVAECFGHSAMSFSSMLMEGADFLISKATSYGCSPGADEKSKFLKLIEKMSKNRESATQKIRTSAYIGHIAVAAVGAQEARSLLNEGFEAPGLPNTLIMAVAAGLNVYNYFDARRQKASGETSMSLSGIKAMAQTNFAEVGGIFIGILGTLAGLETAGNYAVMASSAVVSCIMGRQVLRELLRDPDSFSFKAFRKNRI